MYISRGEGKEVLQNYREQFRIEISGVNEADERAGRIDFFKNKPVKVTYGGAPVRPVTAASRLSASTRLESPFNNKNLLFCCILYL